MGDQKLGVRASSLSLGVTVVLLYVIFVLLVTFGFGSYIYRTSWMNEPPTVLAQETALETAKDTDIDNNIFLLRREQILEDEIQSLRAEIRDKRTQQVEKLAQVKVSYGPISRAEEAMRVHVNVVIADMTEFQYTLSGPYRDRYELILDDPELTPHNKLTALMDLLQAGMPDGAADSDTLGRFEDVLAPARITLAERLAAFEKANAASHKIQQEGKVIQEEINEREKKIEDHEAKITEVRRVLPLDSVIRARLSSLALNIWIAPNIVLRLVSFPTIFLTLIVTIAAGALGTVVAFSRRYYAGHDEGLTLSRLFVNVGEGIAAAIAIFLFSGAGMLALTQGGGAGGDSVELSPYTVAFVAFLSGFMAEDAFASIQAAGKRIFNTEDKDTSGPATGTAPPESTSPQVTPPSA